MRLNANSINKNIKVHILTKKKEKWKGQKMIGCQKWKSINWKWFSGGWSASKMKNNQIKNRKATKI